VATVENEIVIAAPMDLVWQMTNDVESWPTLFTEYADAEILGHDGGTVRFRLTLHPDADGQVWSWVSERTPDPVSRTVQARRIETGPFVSMDIRWEYTDVAEGVLMRWEQVFSVREGLPFGDAEMTERLNTNTRREMFHIKGLVELAARTGTAVAAGRS
jgi:aromatase